MRKFEPTSILIVRLSAIGDVIMASGLIPALRAVYPKARIGWLTEAPNVELLRHNPRLDRLHLWPRSQWKELRQQGKYRQLLREVLSLIRLIRAERYDWVLDLQGLMKSAIWARLVGGRWRIGLRSREGSGLLMNEVITVKSGDRRIGSEYRQLAEFLGALPSEFALDITVAETDRISAIEVLRSENISGDFATIAPFTTRPQKHWFEESWARLVIQLASERNWPVVMLGGPRDKNRAEAISALAGGHIVNLVGKTSLGLCAAIIERSLLHIGVDTGLTHLGVALQRPTLALFGSTCPYIDACNPNARVLYQRLPCSPCRRHPTCGGTFDCMRQHSPDSVLAAAASLGDSI